MAANNFRSTADANNWDTIGAALGFSDFIPSMVNWNAPTPWRGNTESLLCSPEDHSGCPMHIVDTRRDDACLMVPESRFSTPSSFVFLHLQRLFLAFRQNRVEAYDFRGRRVHHFEDSTLRSPDPNSYAYT